MREDISSHTGSTADGRPLAYTRAPPLELRPWIARIGVTHVILPEGATIACQTFAEQPVIRMIYGAPWEARTADGTQRFEPGDQGLALYFGPCTRAMDLKVFGSFRVVSIYCTPGATCQLGLPQVGETNDRIVATNPFAPSGRPDPRYRPQSDVHAWLESCGAVLAEEVGRAGISPPSRMVEEFEALYLTDPAACLDTFASRHGVSRRTLERRLKSVLGVAPRAAMRRARALDMAAALLGVAPIEETPQIALRYYDQPHLNREMHRFFGATPGQLRNGSHPLLLISMEIRQSRRLELLQRQSQAQGREWRDPDAEPEPR